MIRLQRVGKKKFPTYRLVISEKARDPQARSLEILGSYNPHDKEAGLILKEDRIKHWLDNGAQASNTVFNLLLKAGVVDGKKKKAVAISKKRNEKIIKQVQDDKEKKEAEATAKAEKAEAEKAKKEEEKIAAAAEAEKKVEAEKVEEKPVEEVKEEVKEKVAKEKPVENDETKEEVKKDEKPSEKDESGDNKKEEEK